MQNERPDEAMTATEALLTILVKLQMAPVLEAELKDEADRELYELTGKLKQRELAKKLKMGATRISATWQRWERLGLVIKDGNGYRRVV